MVREPLGVLPVVPRDTVGTIPAGWAVTKPSAWATNALVMLSIVALAQGAARGLEIDRGCFDAVTGNEADSLWLDALRDVGLLALGLHVAFAQQAASALTRYCVGVPGTKLTKSDLG